MGLRPTCLDTFAKWLRSRPVHTTGLKNSTSAALGTRAGSLRTMRVGPRHTQLIILADASTPVAALASMRPDVSVCFPAILALAALELDPNGRKSPVRPWNPRPVFDCNVDLPTGDLPSKSCRSFRQFVK